MDFDEAKRRASLAVPNLTTVQPGDSSNETKRFNLSSPQFPVPELIFFGFTQLLGFQPFGPHEKLRWAIQARLSNRYFAIAQLLDEFARHDSGDDRP